MQKAKFVTKVASEDLEEIIKLRSKEINSAVEASEDMSRNIIIFDAETLGRNQIKPKTANTQRNREIPPEQELATLRVDSAANFFATISLKSNDPAELEECLLHVPRPLEYYSLVSKRTLCSQCIIDGDIDRKTLVHVKTLC